MIPILLTAAERDRFATWLECEAQGDIGLAAQAESLTGAATEFLAKRLRAEAAAATIIARKLRAIEDWSASPAPLLEKPE